MLENIKWSKGKFATLLQSVPGWLRQLACQVVRQDKYVFTQQREAIKLQLSGFSLTV